MEVLHLQRQPFDGQVSIERLFSQIRSALPKDVQCRVHQSPRPSKSLTPRLRNICAASREYGDVFHITGDVHYLALGLDRRKTILTIHDCAAFERLRGVKREIFKSIWFKIPINRAAIVTTISEATRRELVRHVGCDPSKIRVIHNCVGPEFLPCPKDFNTQMPVILQVGTAYNKNLERVAEALKGISCVLHIIGRISEPQKALLASSGIEYRNTLRASDAEMVQAYRDCDMLVFASTYEGFGLPILEAQATGRPVITSHLLSMPEVSGDGALFVEPTGIAEIRAAVLQVLQNREVREKLIRAGFDNVQKYSCDVIAGKYAELYRRVFSYGEA